MSEADQATTVPPARALHQSAEQLRSPAQQRIRAVAQAFGFTGRDLLGPWRSATIARARFAAVWLVRETLPLSLPQIGRAFGNRDHSTIASAVRRAKALRLEDAEFREVTDRLFAQFYQGEFA